MKCKFGKLKNPKGRRVCRKRSRKGARRAGARRCRYGKLKNPRGARRCRRKPGGFKKRKAKTPASTYFGPSTTTYLNGYRKRRRHSRR